MSFKKNKYVVIKKAISSELSSFCYDYLKLKRKILKLYRRNRLISPLDDSYGTIGDRMIKDPIFNIYGDPLMETLLLKFKSLMEDITQIELIPTYTYSRIYEKGCRLRRHKDRHACEVSTTMNLGGDPWPIYLDPTNTELHPEKTPYKILGNKGVKVDLKSGDMLVYRGCQLEHWRNKFKGKECAQVFLHYNLASDPTRLYDERIYLGMPRRCKKQ
jgi:hypothetical protein